MSDSKLRQERLKQVTQLLQKKVNEGVDLQVINNASDYIAHPKKYEFIEKAAVPRDQVETKKFSLCFDYLNEDTCVYGQFDPTKSHALVTLFKRVTLCEVRSLISSGIIRDTVKNVGEYKTLFSKLTPDVTQLYETELPGAGRVFFFVTEDKFNIVSIESKHRSND